jgi:hypothetical protein
VQKQGKTVLDFTKKQGLLALLGVKNYLKQKLERCYCVKKTPQYKRRFLMQNHQKWGLY